MEFFNDIGGDPLKPSLFELVAQEQLRDLLQPALKYVLAVSLQSARISSAHTRSAKVFAQRYPRYILRIVNRHEEFYAVLMFLVERHYLRKHGRSHNNSSWLASDITSARCIIRRKFLRSQEKTETMGRTSASPGSDQGYSL